MLKRIAAVVIIVCMAVFVTGCQNPVTIFLDWINGGGDSLEAPETDTLPGEDLEVDGAVGARIRDTVLYYRDSDGYLVPVSVNIEWEEGIARAALQRLISDTDLSVMAQDTGLYSAVPEGTEVLGLTIRDGLAKVDLSAEALNYGTVKEEELMLNSVVYTLTEFNTVDSVQFMIEGDVMETLKFGTSTSGPIEREDINTAGDVAGSRVTIYFHRTNEKGYEYFVPVTLGTGTAGEDMDAALKCLLGGPPGGSGLKSSIPDNVSINGMGIKNGIAYLNFGKGIFDYKGGDSVAENIVKSIALTLKEYPAVTGVVFLVDGQPAQLPTGVVLESVIDVPVFANEYH
ncbi:MAG: GerMN domain-containing protein [Bacillota bacterium]|nr:GerMN domain-containing protein [Bacillota bacterium]MDD3298840.1 GerMN domain-containing protein [Bacillota bacterium]MDD3851832.1 GerMN domain-containing protein [Bacillota bacterium]MDD4708245.1 GerMN domain-containing protein [Bacillota bacterium]